MFSVSKMNIKFYLSQSDIFFTCMPCCILRLPWLRFFHAFSSIVRQMPGCNSQRRNTVRTLLN